MSASAIPYVGDDAPGVPPIQSRRRHILSLASPSLEGEVATARLTERVQNQTIKTNKKISHVTRACAHLSSSLYLLYYLFIYIFRVSKMTPGKYQK